MKTHFVKILVALLGGYILTIVLYQAVLNSPVDVSLRRAVGLEAPSQEAEYFQALRLMAAMAPDEWLALNDEDQSSLKGALDRLTQVVALVGISGSEESFSQALEGDDPCAQPGACADVRDRLEAWLLYGSKANPDRGWSAYSVSPGFLPYLPEPDRDVESLLDALEATEGVVSGTPLRARFREEAGEALGGALETLRSHGAYRLRRYVNGFIQWVTVALTLGATLFVLVFLLPAVRRQARRLQEDSRLLPENGETTVLLDDEFNDYAERVHTLAEEAGRRSRDAGSIHLLSDLCRSFQRSRTVDAVQRTLEAGLVQLEEEIDSRFEMVRYAAWAVPSIGFIGTVLGIGKALFGADRILAADGALEQQGAVQKITADLGTAFDTTLVALVCSLGLMFVYHLAQRFNRTRVNEIHDVLQNRLVRRLQGASLEEIFRDMVRQTALQLRQIEVSKKIKELEAERTELEKEKKVLAQAGGSS